MEPVWNHMLTVDYERTRPTASPLEWDLYTRSLMNWPTILMGDPRPYGRLRRQGIVDIDETDHHELVRRWHIQLHDPDYTESFLRTTTQWHHDTSTHLARLEHILDNGDTSAARVHLGAATAVFLNVMATHIVNWLLPEDDWAALLHRLLGDVADACMLTLMTPSGTGHLLRGHLGTLSATRPAESNDEQASVITSRAQASVTHRTWTAAALLAAAGDHATVIQVDLIAQTLVWAADSEENRAILRSRYLAAVQRWAALAHQDPSALTTTDFHPEGSR